MMTLPAELEHFMQGQDLKGLKPFALLYRNKWNSATNKYALESTPIDISDLIVKPNTLSMTLDVNEIAQYNANNVTLTLADTKNYFVEGTPNSYFPDGYQLYGSRVVLYYGLDGTNRTPLFTGVIKDLPTHKPEQYQVELKLVSPLEMLKDIEAKDFSDKVTGETLTYKSTDSDGHRIYWTSGTGVGGFYAVYANGTKLFEGVDYETDQLNALGLPAIVTIINSAYYGQAITADYYTWKTGLTVEQIVEGLAGLAGYDSGTEDIRNVVWTTEIKTSAKPTALFSLGYLLDGSYSGVGGYAWGAPLPIQSGADPLSPVGYHGKNVFPARFIYSLILSPSANMSVLLGEVGPNPLYPGLTTLLNGFYIRNTSKRYCYVGYWENGERVGSEYSIELGYDRKLNIRKEGNVYTFSVGEGGTSEFPFSITTNLDLNNYSTNLHLYNNNYSYQNVVLSGQELTDLASGIFLNSDGIAYQIADENTRTWSSIYAEKSNTGASWSLKYRTGDGVIFSAWKTTNINSNIGENAKILQFSIGLQNYNEITNINNVLVYYLGSTLTLQLVNLSGSTVLEAMQDFALISGYEFGVDRQGVFFFRPRLQSTTPQYVLDHEEIVKVNTVKKNLNDFFTKLTLTFAERPLEFYANTGDRPTLVDKYGIINKEIDKPDIVNYDNPELAQAIGPQLLETYANLSNTIQVVCKLNLALELGDIVSLRRNFNLVEPEEATDYRKYETQQTFYQVCKIIGLNYNFSKRQITYTLRDLTNDNNLPVAEELYEFVYDFPIQLGAK